MPGFRYRYISLYTIPQYERKNLLKAGNRFPDPLLPKSFGAYLLLFTLDLQFCDFHSRIVRVLPDPKNKGEKENDMFKWGSLSCKGILCCWCKQVFGNS